MLYPLSITAFVPVASSVPPSTNTFPLPAFIIAGVDAPFDVMFPPVICTNPVAVALLFIALPSEHIIVPLVIFIAGASSVFSFDELYIPVDFDVTVAPDTVTFPVAWFIIALWFTEDTVPADNVNVPWLLIVEESVPVPSIVPSPKIVNVPLLIIVFVFEVNILPSV